MKKDEIVERLHKLAPKMSVGSAKKLQRLRKDDLKVLLGRLNEKRFTPTKKCLHIEKEEKEGWDKPFATLTDKNPLCAFCEHGPHEECDVSLPVAEEGIVSCNGFVFAGGEDEQVSLSRFCCPSKEGDSQ